MYPKLCGTPFVRDDFADGVLRREWLGEFLSFRDEVGLDKSWKKKREYLISNGGNSPDLTS
jgi:hypothetical protein